jgi:adenosylcobinamide amidohydrolase
MTKPGFSTIQEIVWLEVRNADLPLHIDPEAFLRRKLSSVGLEEAAAFMTARDIRRHHVAQSISGNAIATCLTTVGLSNAEKAGSRRRRRAKAAGTINTLVHISTPVSIGAFVEAVSIATQARTAAIMEWRYSSQGEIVTGTGTDCIVIAAPQGDAAQRCAGLHTDIGTAIGAAVYEATYDGAKTWDAEAGEIGLD